MLKSMTGYGSGSARNKGISVKIEIKSVNHRFLDLTVRMPRSFIKFENMLRLRLQEAVQRGKVDVFVTIEQEEDSGRIVSLDRPLAQSYLTALEELADLTGSDSYDSFTALSNNKDIFIFHDEEPDEDNISYCLQSAMQGAVQDLDEARMAEGDSLALNLIDKVSLLENNLSSIEKIAPDVPGYYRERLMARAEEILGEERQEWYDDQRLFAEIAIFADKSAIDEELTRLKIHLKSLRNILEGDGPAGRQLDFLLQELNREINTIASKANNVEISQIVVEMKSLLEQVREQVQNIE